MAALTPKMATSVPISWMPASAAMTTIMTLELSAYSSQRMRLDAGRQAALVPAAQRPGQQEVRDGAHEEEERDGRPDGQVEQRALRRHEASRWSRRT